MCLVLMLQLGCLCAEPGRDGNLQFRASWRQVFVLSSQFLSVAVGLPAVSEVVVACLVCFVLFFVAFLECRLSGPICCKKLSRAGKACPNL